MANKVIYTDTEMEDILKSLRSKEPNFNLSGFVKSKLKERIGGFLSDEGEIIKHNIMNEEEKVKFHQNNTEFWKKKYADYQLYLEQKKEEEKELQKKLQEKEKKEQEKLNNIRETFAEEMEREMSETELNDYLTGSFNNIYSFIKNIKQLKGGNTT